MKKKKKVEIYKKAAKKAASKRERKPIETVILFTVSVALMSFVLIVQLQFRFLSELLPFGRQKTIWIKSEKQN